MTATEGIVVLVGRVLVAVVFIRSGIAHVRKHGGLKGYARSAGFPSPPGGGGYSARAALASRSATSVRSQVKSRSSRPKCP